MNSLRMAIRSIRSNKSRAFLTMLGIIIGVMALVVLVSIVNGATDSVSTTISSLGTNYITAEVLDDNDKPLTVDTLNEWVEDPTNHIDKIAPVISSQKAVSYGINSDYADVYGTTSAYKDILGLNILTGRFIKNADVENDSMVCVVNETTAETLIGYTDCVGETISLDGTNFEIVGVVEDDDDSLTAAFRSGSNIVYVPYTSLIHVTSDTTDEITSMYVGVNDDSSLSAAQEEIESIFYDRFESEDNYYIFTQDSLEDTMSSVTSVLSLMLGGIAAISLVVGGIGIMNIMLVTVTERTREIGIRKAIGAKRSNILTQFLTEAVVICMIGCGIGILLSWLLLLIISNVASSLSVSFALDGTVALIAVAFCVVIGLAFGIYPANKAAKMKPIDALHYNG